MAAPRQLDAAFLPAEDLRRFNYWLWITRLRSIAGVLIITLVLAWAALSPPIPIAPALLICGADLLFSLGYRRWLRTGQRLRALAYVQLCIDSTAILAGLYFVQHAAVLFHFVLLLTVVPASMIEWECGMLIAAWVTVGHFLLLWLRGGGVEWLSVAGLLPPATFFLIALQSVFYAQHLAEKNAEIASTAASLNESNRRLEEEAAVSAALLRVAEALTTSLDPQAILERLNDVVRQVLQCDFSVTLVADEHGNGYRVGAVAGTEPEILEEVRNFEFPRDSAPVFAEIARRGWIAVEDRDSALLPHGLLARWHISSVMLADLRRAGASVGLLGAGFNDRRGPFSPRELRLFRSITQQATVALENARLVERLRAASRLKSEFIGTMSHELRSPLNVVIGYVDLLLGGDMGEIGPEPRDALERVQQHALQLLELIQETLDINRLEAGLLPLDFETFPVRDFLEDLKESIPAEWRKREVALTWHADPALVVMRSDRAKLKRVLRNLVHNALKFTDHGTVAVRVGLDNGWVDLSVADTGIGISTEALPVIFDMFRQVDGSSTRRHGGVGLGLYIVKQLVRGLGGDLTVTSTLGEGSTFHVRLRRGDLGPLTTVP